jgi:hypothetical protein
MTATHDRGGEDMADSPLYPDPHNDDTGVGPDRESKPGRPRWVKVSLIIVAIVVILVVVLALTGVFGSEHVPGPPAGGH